MEYLIIAEKPTAARKIAEALDATGRPVERDLGGGKSCLVITMFDSGKPAAICSASGHLYTLEPATRGFTYPVFDFTWTLVKRAGSRHVATMQQATRVLKPAKFVVATDLDMEGSVIGFTALTKACGATVGPATARMSFSTLTRQDLRTAWTAMTPGLDCARVEAGIARHHVDAVFGVNFSRALTRAVKTSGTFSILSIGRVQGPTLHELFKRNQVRSSHVPEPYWTTSARATAMASSKTFTMIPVPATFKEERLATALASACNGASGTITTVTARDRARSPPPPFNLSSLQQEASRLFKFKPSATLKIAEKLYLDALISYPRTESEIIPPSIDHLAILQKLAAGPLAAHASTILSRGNVQPSKGKKTDDAHPPVLPTGEQPRAGSVTRDEARLLDLITRRFLALFGPPATWMEKACQVDVSGYPFEFTCGHVTGEGWTGCYPASMPVLHDDPGLAEGGTVRIDAISITRESTKPPPQYNDMSLVRWMERQGIGTKGTRASIVDVLKNRGYVAGDPFLITPLGKEVITTLLAHAPDVIAVELTRELEHLVDAILSGKASLASARSSTRAALAPRLAVLQARETTIGKALGMLVKEKQVKRPRLGRCPRCNKHDLVLVRSRQKKRSVMCEGRFDKSCDVVLPVIQSGTIKATRKTCMACGFPIVLHVARGKKSWSFCVNWSTCPASQKKEDA